MTADRDFDRIARAWLDLMPDEAPDRAIAAVLDAAAVTPQAGAARRPAWRPMHMTRLSAALVAAALIAAVGGAIILVQQPSSHVGGPTPSPVTDPSVGPSPGAELPPDLAHDWVGDARDIPGVDSGGAATLDFTGGRFAFRGSSSASGTFQSQVSVSPPGVLVLRSDGSAEACASGAVGTYPYSVSPAGRILTITSGTDQCEARQAAVPGTWYRNDGCGSSSNPCFGGLEAGTWKSQHLDVRLDQNQVGEYQPTFGVLTYTVPQGWANPVDDRGRFELQPIHDYEDPASASGREFGIQIFPRVEAADAGDGCPSAAQPSIGTSPAAFVDWIAGQPGVTASPIHDITIDGHAGRWLDVSMAPDWQRPCPWTDGHPYVSLILADRGTFGLFGVGEDEHDRYIFMDLGGGDTVLVLIQSFGDRRFDELIDEAMTIVGSFHFA